MDVLLSCVYHYSSIFAQMIDKFAYDETKQLSMKVDFLELLCKAFTLSDDLGSNKVMRS